MPVPVSSASPRPVIAEAPEALHRDAPEPPSGLEAGARRVADLVTFGAKATLHLGAGPIFAARIEDLASQLVEPEARSERRAGLAKQLEARVRVHVHRRLDVLNAQIDGQRAALLGPNRDRAIRALRGPIARGVQIRADIDAIDAQLLARGAAATTGMTAPVEVGNFVTATLGLDPAAGSIADLMKRRDALRADLTKLVHEHPALGALDLAEVSANLPAPDLQARLRDGLNEAEAVLSDVRRRVDDGDIPLMDLGPMVQAALHDLGVSPARAAQGHEDSELLLEHLEFERNAAMSKDMLLMGVSVALTAAAVLATGPLAGVALAAAGIAFDGGVAWEAYERAEDIEDAATAGLQGDAGITDVEAASQQRDLAIVGGVLTVVSGGAALKHLGRAGALGRAWPSSTNNPAPAARASVVVGDIGEALPPPGRRPVTPDEPTWKGAAAYRDDAANVPRPVTPDEPTWVSAAAYSDDGVARTRPVAPDEPTWIRATAQVEDDAARRGAEAASEAPTAPSRPAASNDLAETGPTLLEPTLTQVRAAPAPAPVRAASPEDVLTSPPVQRSPVTARIRPGSYAPTARGIAPRPAAPPTARVRARGPDPTPSDAQVKPRPTPRVEATPGPEAPPALPGERYLKDAFGPLLELEQMQRAIRELPPVQLAHAVAEHDPKILEELIVLVDARTFLKITENLDDPHIIRLLADPEQLGLLADGPIGLVHERLMRWLQDTPRPAPIDEKLLEPAAPEPPPPRPSAKPEVGKPATIGQLFPWKNA